MSDGTGGFCYMDKKTYDEVIDTDITQMWPQNQKYTEYCALCHGEYETDFRHLTLYFCDYCKTHRKNEVEHLMNPLTENVEYIHLNRHHYLFRDTPKDVLIRKVEIMPASMTIFVPWMGILSFAPDEDEKTIVLKAFTYPWDAEPCFMESQPCNIRVYLGNGKSFVFFGLVISEIKLEAAPDGDEMEIFIGKGVYERMEYDE